MRARSLVSLASLASLAAVVALPACADPPASPAAVAAPAEGSVASADGVPIHYRATGRGEPTVVLVHCWGCSSEEWTDVVPALAATHRVVTLDLAGHGRSGKGRTAWTVPAFTGDVRAVMDHLGVQKAILVGHSMAGAIVIDAAAAMPSRVVGVIPVDALLDVGEADDPAEITKFFDGMRADFPKTTERLVRSIAGKNAPPALVDRLVALELANDPAVAIPVLESNWRFPVKDVFVKVKVPIVSLNADLFPTNVAGNRALAPQYEARILTGVGHWPMLEAPDRFRPMLVQAVADVAKRAQ
jgi:pimeloyl-ACP methyl ester carboxylesterase